MSAASPEPPSPHTGDSSAELEELRVALGAERQAAEGCDGPSVDSSMRTTTWAQTCRALAQDTGGRHAVLDLLLETLENPSSRRAGLHLLHELRRGGAQTPGLRVIRTQLITSSIEGHVDVVLVPSIFEPEDWSYTFLEGLLRQPPELYAGKTFAELGTGSGWISLALLQRTQLDHVYALDINPIAIKVARINAFLNAYDDELKLRLDDHAKPLFERLTTLHSDLLQALIERERSLDFVAGCIPQVLSPDPSLDPELALAEMDEEQLYDLSNYFVLQGVYEDQFGLGLLARALEQSVRVLKRGGKVILNIAGRPGRTIIERMFTRRGYELRELWSRRVQQAADTNISVLAELEQRTGQPFEFFVHAHSREPIGASTALAIQGVQHQIWHDVRVLEGQLRFEQDLGPFYEAIHQLEYNRFWDQIDLSAISAEQVGFLRRLAQDFAQGKLAPYVDVQGSAAFRKLLARYLDQHFGLRVGAGEVCLGPSRDWLMEAISFSLCEAGDHVLLGDACYSVFAESCQRQGTRVVRGNDDLGELTELTRLLEPKLVVVAPAEASSSLVGTLRELAKAASEVGAWLIVDGSQLFDITSQVHTNPICEFLAEQPSGEILTLTGLVKNRVYPQLEPAFMLPCRAELRDALVAFIESSYSRVNCYTDRYYTTLFEDILSFQFERGSRAASLRPAEARQPLPMSPRSLALQMLPAFNVESKLSGLSGPTTVRLDYGENELEMPDRLAQGVLLGFTNLSSDTSPERLQELLAAWRDAELDDGKAPSHLCPHAKPDQFVIGAGVFPLIYDAAQTIRARLGRAPIVALAEGHYGYLPGLLQTAGCQIANVAARAETGFALTAAALETLTTPADILLVTNPNNPSGVFYDEGILRELVAHAARTNSWIFSDEIFSALDLSDSATRAPSLAEIAFQMGDQDRVLRFDGLSKRLAAGGLRVGWLQCSDCDLAAAVRALASAHPVERHARVATDVLLRGFDASANLPAPRAEIETYEANLRSELRRRHLRLSQFWLDLGAQLPPGRPGGLFLFPDVSALYGQRVQPGNGSSLVLGEDNFAEILLSQFGVRVNPAAWAATRAHVRCCFSLKPSNMELAMQRLEAFAAALSG